MSLIKKEIEQLKISFPQIVKAFLLFIFSCSGLAVALFLRFLGINGLVILFISILVELITIILNYFLLRKYFILKEEIKGKEQKSQSYK